MTGKRYYITTLGAWHRHATRFANSHFIVLDSLQIGATAVPAPDNAARHDSVVGERNCAPSNRTDDTTRILVLVEADEGAHLALENETAFEGLPHPLAQKAISDGAQSVLASHGVASGATTFDAAEVVARIHPLLRHCVF